MSLLDGYQNYKGNVELISKTAEEFVQSYFKGMDVLRDQISTLYSDDALLIWNGNAIQGRENIQKFVQKLPSSKHHCHTLDAQPIMDASTWEETIFIIQVGGHVSFDGGPNLPCQQTFILKLIRNVLTILQNTFRTQDYMITGQKKTTFK